MRLVKRIFLLLLAVLVAVQVPFIYRRHLIGQLAERIARLESQRVARVTPGYREYKGVMHVHTSLGGHSTGSFDELIAAAAANGLDFVAMTEHYEVRYDTSRLGLEGPHGGVLFIGGQEIDATDGGRFLVFPGTPDALELSRLDTRTMLGRLRERGHFAINNYPERNRSGVEDFDGMEAYSLHINAKRMNPFAAAGDLLWSFPAYSELTYATYLRRNEDYLQRYDRIASQRRLLLAAGADAHSNKGYYLFADDDGNRHFGFKIDPYEMVLRLVRMHVLIEEGTPLTRESFVDALRRGHAFVGFDVMGDAGGFAFAAENGTERRIMGDEIALASGVRLTAAAPGEATFVLLRNGEKVGAIAGVAEANFTADRPGAYRVEVYRDVAGDALTAAPWIMSNPIYIR